MDNGHPSEADIIFAQFSHMLSNTDKSTQGQMWPLVSNLVLNSEPSPLLFSFLYNLSVENVMQTQNDGGRKMVNFGTKKNEAKKQRTIVDAKLMRWPDFLLPLLEDLTNQHLNK